MQVVRIPTDRIIDWDSFHNVFAEALGFPPYYGRNMDAWIDCLTYADQEDGMRSVTVPEGEVLTLELHDAGDLKERCPELYDAVIECAAFVNWRRIETGDPPVLALSFRS
jgi:RNAse (barnase) inhibitor barstar